MIIELTEDEARVLFELLHDFGSEDDGRRSALTHVAERNALWALAAAIERVLEAPLRADYPELLDAARRRLEEQGGGWNGPPPCA